jgi:glycosyltransferase involved in cell wall biosynthesis
MRIAIFHQFMDNIGGAELVTLTLARELNADIYTTNISKEAIIKTGFKDVLKNIKSIGSVPLSPPFRHQLALYRFSKLNLGDKYDKYIISGDWAVSGSNHHKNIVWYCHSPCRELWDLKSYVRENFMPFWKRPVFDLWVFTNRKLHTHYINKIDKIICNSKNTQNRIKKYLNRKSKILHPPVYVSDFKFKESKNYWLSINRLIPNKRIDLQIGAFRNLPKENLVIVGSYEKTKHFEDYKKYLEIILPKNVSLKTNISKKELVKLYSECKGVISTAKNEDFGLTAIEAMASGKPFIGPHEGGYLETITKDTGVLIKDLNSKKLEQTINNLDLKKFKKDIINKRAKLYSVNSFIKKIKLELK